MGSRPRDVTEAELAVLQVLWGTEECTVREITDCLYPEGGNSESATVQKLCERLEAKIFVSADRRRRPNRYRACVDRESLTVRRLKAVADDLYSGSLTPLVSQLLKGGSFTPQEIETLRDEVERLSEETKRRPAPRKRKRGGAR